ncbi:FMN-binding protein [Agromyces sp. MMS24-JH15]|uniref:FMN-binding protein n=1 Tax=Agromyces sp. MMS24-JH15 TaxID=3243765 RepID=UPI003747A390
MRRRAVILASAASATAILGGWQLGLLATPSAPVAEPATTAAGGSLGSGTGATGATSGATGGDGSSAGASTDASADASSGAASDASTDASAQAPSVAASSDGVFAGATVSTRFGDVQVQVTISGGAITDVTALRLTDHDGRSVSISNRAAPILRDEVLQAQAASVSLVSGATYTSAAYLQSLQAALDEAGF